MPASVDRNIARGNTRRGSAGGVASGAPHGAERTVRRRHALSESQIAWGAATAWAGANTVGLLATTGPAGLRLGSREHFRSGASTGLEC